MSGGTHQRRNQAHPQPPLQRGQLPLIPGQAPGRQQQRRGQTITPRRPGVKRQTAVNRRQPRHAQRIQRRRHYNARAYEQGARQRLQRFRRASILAVALTGLILLFWVGEADPGSPLDAAPAQQMEQTQQGASANQNDQPASPEESAPAAAQDATPEPAPRPIPEPIPDPGTAVQEAASTVRDLVLGAYGMFPKILVALIILVFAWILTRLARWIFRRLTPNWGRADAAGALAGIVIFLIALGAALSVIAGDARALVGSVGLAGLALSWALQTPIESFTGWLLNSFQNYYRVGDRIEVGEVFGDVYRIDVLTTTVWEAGAPGKPVQGAQPTGALITFPNSDVLRANIINYTREFAQVWDEVLFNIAPESDLPYAARIIEEVAERTVGPAMAMRAAEYQQLLERKGLAFDIAVSPTVFISLADAWVNMTVRYLVDARERRRWASDLALAVSVELAREEHRGRVRMASPRMQIQLVDEEGDIRTIGESPDEPPSGNDRST